MAGKITADADGKFGFSPLHEGDASVAKATPTGSCSRLLCFSPLHEGDASVATIPNPVT